jgi:5'-3' exonuclease
MGIFHFFGWFKNNFSSTMTKLSDTQNFKKVNIEIDNLMIDMNGLFHNSSQKVFQYGSFKPPERILETKLHVNKVTYKQQLRVYEDVCNTIEHLLVLVEPKKRLILCVDGPAPYAKQVQQKRRRFKSVLEREDDDKSFDSNQISPGTKFMDNLSKYIDWYLRKKISENPLWQNIEIIFSNEKVPGEGEYKIINYIRLYGNKDEKYCIYGSDADLIMLSLGIHYPNFYILRDDTYDRFNKYFIINVSKTELQLSEIMRWDSEKYIYDPKNAVDDFIFMCFMVGNDFLPHIPSLEIIESGIDILLSIYRDVGTISGHITQNKNNDTRFNPKSLKLFFEFVSNYEKPILEKKLKNRRLYFPDEILENSSTITDEKIDVDIKKYREEYNKKYFDKEDLKKIAHSYLNGLQWVISYYKHGVPDWSWYYEYHYAPSASVFVEHIDTFIFSKRKNTYPLLPFQQLLCILPPKSSDLLPEPLNRLILDEDSPIKKYYPDTFEVDLAGKKNDWQGIVIIPLTKPEIIIKEHNNLERMIDVRDKKRNIFGKSFSYCYDKDKNITFNSYYGNIISCKVNTKIIGI